MSIHARLRLLLSVIGGGLAGTMVPGLFGEHWLVGLGAIVVYVCLQSVVLALLFPEPPVKS